LVAIFKNHFNRSSSIKKLIFPFLQECSLLFKSELWQPRNILWKNKRDQMGLTKDSFRNYRKDHASNDAHNIRPSNSRTVRHNNTSPYFSSCIEDFRNFKLQSDLLFILFSSSNFLHSGSFYSHLNNSEFFTSSNMYNNACLFYVT
jgi:hypothetical protein